MKVKINVTVVEFDDFMWGQLYFTVSKLKS